MRKKTIIAIATLLTFGQVAWAQTTSFTETEDEKGTKAKPFLIDNIAELNALAADVNSGTDYSGVYFQLTDDLDYSGVSLCFDLDEDGINDSNFTPIGCYAIGENDIDDPKFFMGIFDGNNKTITGISVDNPTYPGIGLFGYIKVATIKKLTLVNCTFIGNTDVGSIAGCSVFKSSETNSKIENCKVVGGTVTAEKIVQTPLDEDIPGEAVGGIIGSCSDNLKITNCTSSAMVSGDDYVGGIIGKAGDAGYNATLTESYYTGPNAIKAVVNNYGVTENATINITLLNDDSNATVKNATRISNYNGETANVTLGGRTLSKKNEWNTLCLPFSMDATQIAAGSLNGATIKELNAENSNLATNGTLTLTFSDVSSITAGKPYIVKWGSGDDISDPVFEGVTIDETAPAAVTFTNNANDNGDCKFVGQYSPFSITDGNKNEIIMLGSSSRLGYSRNERTLKCFRAHFYVPANGGGAPARAFVMDFGDGETTEIIGVTADQRSASATYTLDGRRINDLPTQKGMYIQNGRKVIIK